MQQLIGSQSGEQQAKPWQKEGKACRAKQEWGARESGRTLQPGSVTFARLDGCLCDCGVCLRGLAKGTGLAGTVCN